MWVGCAGSWIKYVVLHPLERDSTEIRRVGESKSQHPSRTLATAPCRPSPLPKNAQACPLALLVRINFDASLYPNRTHCESSPVNSFALTFKMSEIHVNSPYSYYPLASLLPTSVLHHTLKRSWDCDGMDTSLICWISV
jgi:hypothetical protein